MKTGLELITEERQRQINEEGWDESHDDAHIDRSLAKAAACYANPLKYVITGNRVTAIQDPLPSVVAPLGWPDSWSHTWWKPGPTTQEADSYKRRLIKAGALIAAELDRLNRLEDKEKKG